MKDKNNKFDISLGDFDVTGYSYDDLYIPSEAMDYIKEASNKLIREKRSNKIDRLLDEK